MGPTRSKLFTFMFQHATGRIKPISVIFVLCYSNLSAHPTSLSGSPCFHQSSYRRYSGALHSQLNPSTNTVEFWSDKNRLITSDSSAQAQFPSFLLLGIAHAYVTTERRPHESFCFRESGFSHITFKLSPDECPNSQRNTLSLSLQ